MICMFSAIQYFYQMYLKVFEICLKIYELDPALFLTTPDLAW